MYKFIKLEGVSVHCLNFSPFCVHIKSLSHQPINPSQYRLCGDSWWTLIFISLNPYIKCFVISLVVLSSLTSTSEFWSATLSALAAAMTLRFKDDFRIIRENQPEERGLSDELTGVAGMRSPFHHLLLTLICVLFYCWKFSTDCHHLKWWSFCSLGWWSISILIPK